MNVVSYASFSMSKRKVTFEDGDGEITLEDVPKKKVGLMLLLIFNYTLCPVIYIIYKWIVKYCDLLRFIHCLFPDC